MREAKPTGRPVIPKAVEVSEDELIFFEDGRPPRAPVHMMFDPYDVGRIQAGYVCLQCKEDLDTAFPDKCPICGYRMAQRQAADFALEFKGVSHVGPTTTDAEEREIMQELRRREAVESGKLWTPSILVPRDL